ncbi:MAG: protein kinase domain-containing protein, partial [Nocardioides sp.]
GTDGYLGPEQVTGVGLTTATDVFGLGVTLGEAMTGELAHGEETRWRRGTAPRRTTRHFRRRTSHLPAHLLGLIEACVDPDPRNRPSLEEIQVALTTMIEAGPEEGAAL